MLVPNNCPIWTFFIELFLWSRVASDPPQETQQPSVSTSISVAAPSAEQANIERKPAPSAFTSASAPSTLPLQSSHVVNTHTGLSPASSLNPHSAATAVSTQALPVATPPQGSPAVSVQHSAASKQPHFYPQGVPASLGTITYLFRQRTRFALFLHACALISQ
jgi:hypothetical protein